MSHRCSSKAVFTLGSVVLLICLLLGACGTPEPTPAPTATLSPTTLGRTVGFDKLPQRLVVAGKSSLTIVETLYLFPEARERLVGLTVGSQKPADFLAFVDPTFAGKATLEVEAGPEQIAPLSPDVVVLRSFMAEKLGKPLEQLSIPVVYVDLETPEQYFRDLATLGQLLGNEARVEEIRSFYQSRLDELSDKLQGLDEAQKPRVLIVQYSDKGGEIALNVPSVSWLQTIEAEMAGGVPVWKEAGQAGGWTVVNFEQIAAWDPDQIFVIHYTADSAQIAEQLATDPKWQVLKAVRNGQIYGFPSDVFSWDQPEPRWILGLIWLASKIHPNRFPDLDMMQEASQFFVQMYGMDETTIQQQILPKLKGNVE